MLYSVPVKTTYLFGADIGSLGARAISPIATPFLTPMVAEYVKEFRGDNECCPCYIAFACAGVDHDIMLAVGCGQSYQWTYFVEGVDSIEARINLLFGEE